MMHVLEGYFLSVIQKNKFLVLMKDASQLVAPQTGTSNKDPQFM